MFTMKSKYNSRCKYCGDRVGEGDTIAKGEIGWGHVRCVKGDIIEPMEKPVTVHEMQAVKTFESSVEMIAVFDPLAPAVEVDTPSPVQSKFIPSSYQQAIFDFGLNGQGNLVVNATAGSGKTRTIQEFIKGFISTSNDWIYLVFNKKNQVEAQEKFGKDTTNGQVSTFHSFCLNNSIKQVYSKVRIDDKKSYKILDLVADRETEKELFPLIVKAVGLVKNTLTDANDYEAMIAMCDHYGVELNGSAARVLELVRNVIDRSKMDAVIETIGIDFDDMLWLTVIRHLSLPAFDYVLVDETQDLNAVQIEIVLKIRKDGGRTIAIGDTNQAIYGFRGADADAMDKVIAALNASTLPLSLCYRNPKSVVRLVNETLPHIKHECLPDAVEGEVLTIDEQDLQACVKPGDMVICRTNAPLVRPCFELIRKGIKAVIMGRSIGDELVNLINRVTKRIATDNLEIILSALVDYKNVEVNRLIKQGKESTAEALEDKIDTIFALADGCTVLSELSKKAQTIFSDDAKGVVFSSAHRAKGLEADSVFILKYDLMPHPMAKQGWQLTQEQNIKFVALTRARMRLYFVNGIK